MAKNYRSRIPKDQDFAEMNEWGEGTNDFSLGVCRMKLIHKQYKHLTIFYIILSLFILSSTDVLAVESYKIDTNSNNLFQNIVSDTILLLDNDLQHEFLSDYKKIIADSTFQLEKHSWKPRSNPVSKIKTIYLSMDSKNIKNSFSSMIKPLIEIGCSPLQPDPLNELLTKCIKNLLRYPIIDTVIIDYEYRKQSVDKIIHGPKVIDENSQYQRMVITLADLINNGYARINNNNISKVVKIVKYPLPHLAASAPPPMSAVDLSVINYERIKLESDIDSKRLECTDTGHKMSQRKNCDNALKEIRNELALLQENPFSYFSGKYQRQQIREGKALDAARRKEAIAQKSAESRARASEETSRSANQDISGPAVMRDQYNNIVGRGWTDNDGHTVIRNNNGNIVGKGFIDNNSSGVLKDLYGNITGRVVR